MSVELSYYQSLEKYGADAARHKEKSVTALVQPSNIGYKDVLRLGQLTLAALPLHRSIRKAVQDDEELPEIVRNDPQSLRSTLWMVLIKDIIVADINNIKNTSGPMTDIKGYQYKLFTLTRCWINGLDDVMDQAARPLTKQILMSNSKQNKIQTALAKEFYRLFKDNPKQRSRILQTVREYRHLRDFWAAAINKNEGQSTKQNFEQALEYNIETMGPLTYILVRTVSVDRNLDLKLEEELNHALVLYATAGKLIDDMTDWLKDHNRGESNLFTLALEESGELETVIKNTSWISQKFGKKAFVPITLFKLSAPKASKRYFEMMDKFIGQLEKTDFTQLAMSMKGVRQAMWAYALNEGLPQVT